MNRSGIKPKQKVSSHSKSKKWADETADYYRGVCVEAVDRDDALRNYRLANGELDESEYLYVTNPQSTKRPELLGAPARLKNWDIIVPNFELLRGEKARRQFPPIVYAKNSDYHIQQLEMEQQLLVQHLQQRWINAAKAYGVPLEEEQVTMKMEDIANKVKNLPDYMANQGQDALEYIMDHNQLPRQFRKGFYDWLCQACVYTYKDVHKDETYHEVISPIHIRYLCSPIHDFINRGEAVICTHNLSVNEIYDRFQDADGFDQELQQYLDDYTNSTSSTTGEGIGYRMGSTDIMHARAEFLQNVFGGRPREDYANGITVEHVMWRSQTKIGVISIPTPDGTIEEFIVDDSFKPMLDDIIEWEWRDQIWENYCVDDKFWLGARAIPIQSEKHPTLLYNGRNMMSRHTRPKPLVKRGEAYQKSVNIIKYRAEMTLAKNLDKVILFPLGLIPEKEGWDVDKLMYFVRSFSFLFFDETRPNAHLMIQAMKDLDVSSWQHILQAHQLIEIIKREWDEACGIIPQRKGQVGTSAGKGVTQEANDRSYVMSEEMFLEYEEFEREEYEAMLELSKYAFSRGKQAHFIKQDGTKAFLDLHSPETFLFAEYGVFVKNGAREFTKLEMLRQHTQAFAQNEVDPKMIASIIEAENFSKLHVVMDEIQAKMDARTARAQQIEQEQTQAQLKIAEEKKQFDYYDVDLKSYTDIQVALINAGMQMADQSRQMEESGKTASPEYQDLRYEREKNAIDLQKNAIKLKEIASKERMNTQDNKTKLKDKVAGEK